MISHKEPQEFNAMLKNLKTPPLQIGTESYAVGPSLLVGLSGYYRGEVKDLCRPNSDQLTPEGEDFLHDIGLE